MGNRPFTTPVLKGKFRAAAGPSKVAVIASIEESPLESGQDIREMKSLARQSVAEMGGWGSVLSRQKRDHIRLDRLLDELEGSPASRQDAVLLSIYRLVFPHAYAEETIVWPLIRRVLPDGHELTLRVELEHQEINELAIRVEALEPGSIERGQALSRMIELLREDVRDEEDVLLPRLQEALSPARLRRVGLAWEAVRRTAPTRPHAVVSRRPPGNVLAALPLAFLDRCRDGVDALLDRGAGPAPLLRGLGSALARASHAVGRAPGLQRGEDPATHISPERRVGWKGAALVAVASASAVMILRARRR
jgi:hypothetical protein